MLKFDFAVIGGGAGLIVLEKALHGGYKCALVERAKLGGTCLTKGCIPTKMMVYPADLIRETQRAGKASVNLGTARVDWDGLQQRIWTQIDQHKDIEESLGGIDELTLFKGTGAFTGPRTMKVAHISGGETEFEAERFIVAAGGRSYVPAINGLEAAGYVTAETFFGDNFPAEPYQSLIILGGGAIGAEFAHIFSAFGTKVTLVEMQSRLIATEEEEISAFLQTQFADAGIRVLTNSRIVSVKKTGRLKSVEMENAATGIRTVLEAQEIFIAAGSRANTDLLDATKAGLETDERGWIVTNEHLITSQPHIWALGDINGKYQFRHKANYEADIVAYNLFDKPDKPKTADYASVPWAVFTHPQIAHVGMTENEARVAGLKIMVGRNHYSEIAGGIAMGYRQGDADDGFFKLIVDENAKIVGAHIAGPQAAVLLQPFVYLMNAGFKCNLKSITDSEKSRYANRFKSTRTMCPHGGTYTPITSSMAIHPSLNELTAWVIGKLEWA